jgi:hypothetical protein
MIRHMVFYWRFKYYMFVMYITTTLIAYGMLMTGQWTRRLACRRSMIRVDTLRFTHGCQRWQTTSSMDDSYISSYITVAKIYEAVSEKSDSATSNVIVSYTILNKLPQPIIGIFQHIFTIGSGCSERYLERGIKQWLYSYTTTWLKGIQCQLVHRNSSDFTHGNNFFRSSGEQKNAIPTR